MKEITITIQGKKFSPDSNYIQNLIAENPSWGRKRISIELCQSWNWSSPNGQLKDMSCRNLLLKLEKLGCITLPPRQNEANNASRNRIIPAVTHQTKELSGSLKLQTPLIIEPIGKNTDNQALFNYFVSKYHYLGYKAPVGENIKYLVRSESGNPLACLLFAGAAWKTASRDSFIGWSSEIRIKNLSKITNNTRFLILPWVKIPNLASHILSVVSRRINTDWIQKYGHPIYALETFVDLTLFKGSCYKAANWILIGQTTGRTRNDRRHTISTSLKDVYLYPLTKRFRQELCYDV